ncbi:MAG: carbamate kinase [Candidatus Heimdallarchaeum endolithica]|uniref:Carbamate kinase n=1 Tax=Candidatus Heimdallarchaeum endolithica TaxID=2876572 RepID=A0A9Y1FR50_9ARCH|nr:MAG: carbamate kinase [Candidatus Heimdallarchaeum endolithica]
MKADLIVIALGGNMILQRGQKGTFEEQMENTQKASVVIADLVEQGYKLVLTSGNGPQVGNILAQQNYEDAPSMPLYVCGAMSQGQIGYMISMTLQNEFKKRNKEVDVITLSTRVIVDKNDPGFSNPTKPIGRFYTKDQADKFNEEGKGPYMDDAGRGYRLFVASPQPLEIVEKKAIQTLADSGMLVYCVGGGGIPVVKNDDGTLEGAMAVIDKDRASAVLAEQIDAGILMILTDVPHACLNYKKEDEKPLGEISLALAMQYYDEGHFIKGSMGPKIEAAIRFVKKTQGKAIITNPENAIKAIKGEAGTIVVP